MKAGIRAGELDQRIVIEEATITKNEYNEEEETWATFEEVWADYLPFGGREFWSSQQITAKAMGTFGIRYLPGLLPTMRISYQGMLWDIQRIDDDGRKTKMVIFANTREEGT